MSGADPGCTPWANLRRQRDAATRRLVGISPGGLYVDTTCKASRDPETKHNLVDQRGAFCWRLRRFSHHQQPRRTVQRRQRLPRALLLHRWLVPAQFLAALR